MNKVYPHRNDSHVDLMSSLPSMDLSETYKWASYDISIVPMNVTSSDSSQIQEDVASIKEESNFNEDKSDKISLLVNFIRDSLSSQKRKADINIVTNQKLKNSFKNNAQLKNLDYEANSEISPKCFEYINKINDSACRICQDYQPENELVTPCLCSGTMEYIHQSCLQRWIQTRDNRHCELCKYEFNMKVVTKPLKDWQKLEMTTMERRKVICSATFHVIALTCIMWSLYILIERTSQEMRDGRIEWQFWTKLVVIAIGFLGGFVFIYVQCRMYVSLCRRLLTFNRGFTVESLTFGERAAAQKNAKLMYVNSQKDVIGYTSCEPQMVTSANVIVSNSARRVS